VSDRVEIPLDGMIPSTEEILHAQGIPRNAVISDQIKFLVEESLDLFLSNVRQLCVTRPVLKDDFDDIFRGEGENEEEAPLKAIYPQADHLVVFALTMGDEVGRIINQLLADNNFALGSMLDTTASLATENSVGYLESLVAKKVAANTSTSKGAVVLNYSPGYCGWHISAQKKVFGYLHPEQIGMTLNDSYLMTPLKSATGVLVHGDSVIHHFENRFSFCSTCRDQTCVERRARLSTFNQSTL